MVDHRKVKCLDDYQILCANCNWIKKVEQEELYLGERPETRSVPDERVVVSEKPRSVWVRESHERRRKVGN